MRRNLRSVEDSLPNAAEVTAAGRKSAMTEAEWCGDGMVYGE